MELELTVAYEREGDWWLASVLEIPGAHSQGKSRDEAREMAMDAVRELGFARRDAAVRQGAMDMEILRARVSVPSAA